MNNPFEQVPLNTKQSYCVAKTHGGCEIFLPVDSDDAQAIEDKKTDLVAFLANQPLPEVPDAPPPKLA